MDPTRFYTPNPYLWGRNIYKDYKCQYINYIHEEIYSIMQFKPGWCVRSLFSQERISPTNRHPLWHIVPSSKWESAQHTTWQSKCYSLYFLLSTYFRVQSRCVILNQSKLRVRCLGIKLRFFLQKWCMGFVIL